MKWSIAVLVAACGCGGEPSQASPDGGPLVDATVRDGGRDAAGDASVLDAPPDSPVDASIPVDGAFGCDPPTRLVDVHRTTLAITTADSLALTIPRGPELTIDATVAPAAGATRWGTMATVRRAGTRDLAAEVPLPPASSGPGTHQGRAGVLAGAYDLELLTTQAMPDGSAIYQRTYATTDVCGDTAASIVVDALPALTSKTVTIDLTSLPPARSTRHAYVIMSTQDGSIDVIASGEVTTRSSLVLAMSLPPVPLVPSFIVTEIPTTPSPDAPLVYRTFERPVAAVAASYAFAIPAHARISGAIADPSRSLAPVPAESYVACAEQPNQRYAAPITSFYRQLEMSYALPVQLGTTCDLYAWFAVPLGTNSWGLVETPVADRERIAVNGEVTRSFTVPAVPADVAVQVRTVDADGNLVRERRLLVRGAMTGVADAMLTHPTVISATGQYTFDVPPGAYTVTAAR